MKRRETVEQFADDMERALKRNDWKGGWSDDLPIELFDRLREEVDELGHAIERGLTPAKVIREAADVANFAMMIADLARALITDGRS